MRRLLDQVHDSCQRRLNDLSLGRRGAVILLQVRRFIRGKENCSRRIFDEPFARLAAPYVCFTTRLYRMLECLGLAGRTGRFPTAGGLPLAQALTDFGLPFRPPTAFPRPLPAEATDPRSCFF